MVEGEKERERERERGGLDIVVDIALESRGSPVSHFLILSFSLSFFPSTCE
jgi:hypothetical protein